MEEFSFCPERQVPETLVRDTSNTVTMNGWLFSARPVSPMQLRFRVRLFGLRWYLNNDDTYDSTTNPDFNARALEEFYSEHEQWKSFGWYHPHLGWMAVKFAAPVSVPAAAPNQDGLLEPLEIVLVQTGAYAPAFTPELISPEYWFDPSDLTTLFQDIAGSVPVTAHGQTVRRMNNKGSKGGYFQDAVGATYNTDGTYHWLNFDGVDDKLSGPIELAGASSIGYVLAGEGGGGVVFSVGGFSYDDNWVSTLGDFLAFAAGGLDQASGGLNTTTKAVQRISPFSMSNPVGAERIPMYINRVLKPITNDTGGVGSFNNSTSYFAYRTDIGAYTPFKFYGSLIKINGFGIYTADVEDYLAEKMGITL